MHGLTLGPSQAKINCVDNGDGSADVSYLPTVPGEYAVHILCDNEDIPKSPYMAQIQPATRDFNPGQVQKTTCLCLPVISAIHATVMS